MTRSACSRIRQLVFASQRPHTDLRNKVALSRRAFEWATLPSNKLLYRTGSLNSRIMQTVRVRDVS